MAMKADGAAPSPRTMAEWRPGEAWDCQPGLRPAEKAALKSLSDYFAGGGKSSWPPIVRAGLTRLILPLRETLGWMNAAKAPANSAVHDVLVEMHRLGKSYWGWTQEEWLDVMCISEGAFRTKYGSCGNCRQYVLALAWLLCGFHRLESVGCFYQYRLSVKVFGRPVTDAAISQLREKMQRLGFVADNNCNGSLLISTGSQ